MAHHAPFPTMISSRRRSDDSEEYFEDDITVDLDDARRPRRYSASSSPEPEHDEDEEDTSLRASVMGPKLTLVSRAPWEPGAGTGDLLAEEDELDDSDDEAEVDGDLGSVKAGMFEECKLVSASDTNDQSIHTIPPRCLTPRKRQVYIKSVGQSQTPEDFLATYRGKSIQALHARTSKANSDAFADAVSRACKHCHRSHVENTHHLLYVVL